MFVLSRGVKNRFTCREKKEEKKNTLKKKQGLLDKKCACRNKEDEEMKN